MSNLKVTVPDQGLAIVNALRFRNVTAPFFAVNLTKIPINEPK